MPKRGGPVLPGVCKHRGACERRQKARTGWKVRLMEKPSRFGAWEVVAPDGSALKFLELGDALLWREGISAAVR